MRDEEQPRHDDEHDDAHVHVPHEHALLRQSSLRFSIIADRDANRRCPGRAE